MSDSLVSPGHVNLLATLEGHEDRVWQVTWKPSDTTSIASCSGDKTVRLWQGTLSAPWKCTHILEGAHNRTVRSVAFSPSDSLLASAGFDSTTAIWEQEFNQQYGCIANLEGHESEVKSVAFSASGRMLATCSRDKSIWIWEVGVDGFFECLSVLQEHTQDIKMVIWHPKYDLLASASYDDTIKIWREDEDDWACVSTLVGHESTVWSLDFNRDGSHLVSCSEDKTIRFWKRSDVGPNQERWDCVCILSNQFDASVYSISWSKNLEFGPVVACSGDNSIKIFTVDSSAEIFSCKQSAVIPGAHGLSDINCVAWRPCDIVNKSLVFASGGDDEVVRIWEYGF